MSCAKPAEPIEMAFGMWDHVAFGWDHGTAYLVGTGSPPPQKRGNLGASPYKYRECNYYDCGEYVKLIRYVAALQRCGLSLSVLQQLVITIKAQDRRSGRWK